VSFRINMTLQILSYCYYGIINKGKISSSLSRIVDEHKVNTMFTAPTALRAIRQIDPENSLAAGYSRKSFVKSLTTTLLITTTPASGSQE
jgi:acyl-coenzyme A synthetase/AMP-(fatty) acid ligase